MDPDRAGRWRGARGDLAEGEPMPVTVGRRLGGIIAAGIGSLVGGYGSLFLTPALRGDRLTTAVAALAGALWLSWTTNVFTARRRRGDGVGTLGPSDARASRRMEMPAYDAARQALVDGLTDDASAHDAGRYAEVGWRFTAIRDAVARQDASVAGRLHVALCFWRGWMQARDRRWQAPSADGGIATADWPRLARRIASDLALDRDVSDPTVRRHFAPATAPLTTAPGSVSASSGGGL